MASIRQQAIFEGKYFTVVQDECSKLDVPDEQEGFDLSFVPKAPLRTTIDFDLDNVSSLVMVNRDCELLNIFANKLPLLLINNYRLMWTAQTFNLKKSIDSQSAAQQALEFYLKTDIEHIRKKNLKPNEQFSELLHLLKKTGYLEYVFALARTLHLNVDYVMCGNSVARFHKTGPGSRKKGATGYITVVRHECKWYVKTTQTPIASPLS